MKWWVALAALTFSVVFTGCLGMDVCIPLGPITNTCPMWAAPPPWMYEGCAAKGGHFEGGPADFMTCCRGPPNCVGADGHIIPFSELPTPTPEPSITATPTMTPHGERYNCTIDSDCMKTGCSGQVCANQDVITTCEYRPSYACYANAACGCFNGSCGWAQTPELASCLQNPPPLQ